MLNSSNLSATSIQKIRNTSMALNTLHTNDLFDHIYNFSIALTLALSEPVD